MSTVLQSSFPDAPTLLHGRRRGSGRRAAALSASALQDAVLAALAYGDIFDYPLTREEVFTVLPVPCPSRAAVDGAIGRLLASGAIETNGVFYLLPSRGETAARRAVRAEAARLSWLRARRYSRLIWCLPGVRMVAVTGSLAVDNVQPEHDIDLLIVTAPGRLWTVRGMTVLLARLTRLGGARLCPNYLITTNALRLPERNLYTAHELAQMVPLHGTQTARRLWHENRWCREILPNARWKSWGTDEMPWGAAWLKGAFERLLGLPGAGILERWERERKIAKLSTQALGQGSETTFDADVCKGHQSGHGQWVLRRYTRRLADLIPAQTRPA